RIHQMDDVESDGRLLAVPERLVGKEARRSVAAQVRDEHVIALRRQQRRHIDIAMDVVGPAVQEDDRSTVGGSGFCVADVQESCIDLLDGAERHMRLGHVLRLAGLCLGKTAHAECSGSDDSGNQETAAIDVVEHGYLQLVASTMKLNRTRKVVSLSEGEWMLNDSRPPIHTLRPRTLSAPLWALGAAESTENRTRFGEGLHAGNAELASKPRQFEAAKGRLWVVDQFVDHHAPRLQAVSDRTGAFPVRAVDIGVQAVFDIVCDRDSAVLVVVRDHDEHGPEDLLLGDGHVVTYVCEKGWLDEIAGLEALWLPKPSCHQFGALLQALPDVALDLLPMARSDHRLDSCFGVDRITGLQRLHGALECRLEFLSAALGNQDAGSGDARRPRVNKSNPQRELDGTVDVGIRQDQGRRLAAELQRYALHGLGRVSVDPLADHGGASEGDLLDVGTARDGVANGITASVHYVDHSGRQP